MASSIWAGYPASYTPGRARPIQFVTLHYTAGAEGPTAAENGVAYDKRRTDGTSCGYFCDSQGLALQEVPDGDRSHSALFHGNEIGIHIEICGTKQSRNQWLDPVSYATLVTTANLVRDLCDRHGLAKRRLSVAETRAAYYNAAGSRPTGINDHYDCTRAFPEDGGDHTDVGADFPWDVFMGLVTQNQETNAMAFLARDGQNKLVLITDDWNGWYRPVQNSATDTNTYITDRAYWRGQMGLPAERWLSQDGGRTQAQFNFGDDRTNGLFGLELKTPGDSTGSDGGDGPVDLTDDAVDQVVNEMGRRLVEN